MNFCRRYALDFAAMLLAAAVSGCGPDDGLKELEAGRKAYALKDYGKAEKCFRDSVAVNPSNVDAMVAMAQVYLELGRLQEAVSWIAKAEADAGEDVDVRLLSAQIAWHSKDYDKAYRIYSLLSSDGMLDAKVRSRAWAGMGIVEMARNEFQLARVDFLRALRIDRRNAQAWYHLGLLYRDGFGYHDAALEQLNVYVRLETVASPRVQKIQRVVIPGLREMITRAASERPGVASRNSSLAATAIAKAEKAWKSGRYAVALKHYQEAFAADPLSYPAALGLANAYLKTDASAAGAKKALDCFKSACALRPGAFSTYLKAGELAERLSLHAQAVEIYSKAVAANPSSLAAVDGLINAFRRAGSPKKVISAYRQYREILPSAAKK